MPERSRRPAAEPRSSDRNPIHVRLGERRLVDLYALAGAVAWVASLIAGLAGAVALGPVDRFIALAVLVLVPLGLGLLDARDGPRSPLSPIADPVGRLAAGLSLPAALAVLAALVWTGDPAVGIALTLPWVAVTGGLSLAGLDRLWTRGVRPLPELSVTAALLYVPVGAVALTLHLAGVSFHFRPIIIKLTAVHYHYAGFVLTLVAGVVSRRLAGPDRRLASGPAGRLSDAVLLVIVANIGIIAIGITFSPVVEVVAVAFFTVAVAAFGALVLRFVVPAVDRPAGALLALAAVALFCTMALALAYGYSEWVVAAGATRADRLIGIGGMIRYHGALNAFAFALPALLACRQLRGSDQSGPT
jgi:hypothetical protein